MEIGAQLYTVREFCRTPEGLAQTLTRIAEMGYQTVQVSGTCDWKGEWLREQLTKNGLRCPVTHTAKDRLIHDLPGVMADHRAIGCPYVGMGYWAFDESRDMGYEAFLSTWPQVGRGLREGGFRFLFHNHDREFIHIDGKPILRRLAELIPPEDMGFILDTYWIQFAGADPAAWIEDLRGRVPCLHLKDCAWGHKMAVLGEGNMNFDRILKAAEYAGTEYLLVEQDDCGGEDPFACLRRSYQFLRARGLA